MFHCHHHSINTGRLLYAHILVQSEEAIKSLLLIPILGIPFFADCIMLVAIKGAFAQSKLLAVRDASLLLLQGACRH